MPIHSMYLRQFALPLLLACTAVQAEVLRRGLGPEPDSLDIHQAQGLSAIQVLRDTHEGLITYDAHGELTGGVAESWEISTDGRVYRFRLRAAARWSNGDPLVANDFVRAWQAALSPATQARTAGLMVAVAKAREVMAGEADPVELGIRAEGPGELTVELEHASPWFLEILAHPVSYPMHARGGVKSSERHSNGAFRISAHVPHSSITLQADPNYHGASSVRLKELEYLPIEDPGSELSRFRADELDITETIPPGRYDWLRENLPAELRIAPYLGTYWLGVNMRREPLGVSVDLRRALMLAIDRDTLTRIVTGAGETPAWSVVPPGLDDYLPQADGSQRLSQEEREAEARALYATSGYGPDRPLRVQLRFNTSAQHRRLAVAVAAMWKQVLGVHAELMHEEWKVFVNNRRQGVLTEIFRGGWIADYADPATFLDLFRAGEELNTTFYANSRFDDLLDQAASRDGKQRFELLQQAETLLMRDMPVIPLYYYVSRHLVKTRVNGFHDNVRDVHLSRYLSIGPGTQ